MQIQLILDFVPHSISKELNCLSPKIGTPPYVDNKFFQTKIFVHGFNKESTLNESVRKSPCIFLRNVPNLATVYLSDIFVAITCVI